MRSLSIIIGWAGLLLVPFAVRADDETPYGDISTSKNNDCGAIYEVSAPRVNACKAPVFQAGEKIKPVVMSVVQNGVTVHDHVKVRVDNPRSGLGGKPSEPDPIMLQDHGNPVQYRNIWLLPRK
jgi:hypothetical protein